jgi:hypothetical protein
MGPLGFFRRKKKAEKKEEKEEKEKEEDLLKGLCGDDSKLYDVLGSTLYIDPIAVISEKDLEILMEEAERNIKDKNYEKTMRKYRLVLDKAIFEATQNPGKRGRYTKVIQDLASKAIRATEKVKEKVEKKGLTDTAASLDRRIEKYKLMSERIEDVINVASHYYNERLVMLGEKYRRKERWEKMREMEGEEKIEAEREEARIDEREAEGREARRKERREARRKRT